MFNLGAFDLNLWILEVANLLKFRCVCTLFLKYRLAQVLAKIFLNWTEARY